MRNLHANSLAKKKKTSTRIAASVFLFPALALLFIFIAFPAISTFRNSMLDWNGISTEKVWVGFSNWQELARDKNFWAAFSNNLIVVFLSLLFQVPFAMALATFIDFKGKKATLFKILWFIPYLMSSVAIGILFRYTLDANYGVVAAIHKLFGGGSVDLLGNPRTALYTVIAVICWQYIPFYMVYYLAAYGNIPIELYEAAKIDGATNWQYFWKIALPQLKPTIISGVILSIIGSLKYFDLIFVMTGGGPGVCTELMATYMYRTSFMSYNMGYGSAIAAGMFILITLIALITIKLLGRIGRDGS